MHLTTEPMGYPRSCRTGIAWEGQGAGNEPVKHTILTFVKNLLRATHSYAVS